MIRKVVAVAAVMAVAGCGAGAAASAGRLAAVTGSSTAGPAPRPPARSVCVEAFPHRPLSGWMPATVGALRSYQYGGPVARLPLRTAFPGLRRTHPAAWCVLQDGPDVISLWGVVPGNQPRRAIRIVGPGDRRLGRMDRPPQVP